MFYRKQKISGKENMLCDNYIIIAKHLQFLFEKFFTKKCSLSGILRQLKIIVWTNETHCAIFYPRATHRVAISGTTGSYERIAQNLNY